MSQVRVMRLPDEEPGTSAILYTERVYQEKNRIWATAYITTHCIGAVMWTGLGFAVATALFRMGVFH